MDSSWKRKARRAPQWVNTKTGRRNPGPGTFRPGARGGQPAAFTGSGCSNTVTSPLALSVSANTVKYSICGSMP